MIPVLNSLPGPLNTDECESEAGGETGRVVRFVTVGMCELVGVRAAPAPGHTRLNIKECKKERARDVWVCLLSTAASECELEGEKARKRKRREGERDGDA